MAQQQQHQHVFEEGALAVRLMSLKGSRDLPPPRTSGQKNRPPSQLLLLPPKPLLIAAPQERGDYPVVFIFHGFLLLNRDYTQLIQHVASHGFIVIAPQMYINITTGEDATQEIADAAAIINWLPDGLAHHFPEGAAANVRPRLDKLALVGHSRGAKVAFGLALGLSTTSLKVCAVAGLDPVDGRDAGHQTKPPILKFSKHCFDLKLPILIVGSGLGALKANAVFPPCAPEGVSHKAFFSDSSDPAFYFVASEHGHMDFLDDTTHGLAGKFSYFTSRNGPSRAPMRRFAAGCLVAFFQAAMFSEPATLQALLVDPSLAPVKLETPEWYIATTSFSSDTPELATVFG